MAPLAAALSAVDGPARAVRQWRVVQGMRRRHPAAWRALCMNWRLAVALTAVVTAVAARRLGMPQVHNVTTLPQLGHVVTHSS